MLIVNQLNGCDVTRGQRHLTVGHAIQHSDYPQGTWRTVCVVQEVENQLQQEYETSREQISSLEDQLMTEKRRRDDAEIEVSKQKQVRH